MMCMVLVTGLNDVRTATFLRVNDYVDEISSSLGFDQAACRADLGPFY